jgi:hypothetical protein
MGTAEPEPTPASIIAAAERAISDFLIVFLLGPSTSLKRQNVSPSSIMIRLRRLALPL